MRWLFPVLTLGYCALIFWLSHQPLVVRDDLDVPHLDKAVHAAVYGLMAWLAGQSLAWSGRRHGAATLFWGPLVFASLYGLTDEVHQAFVPARNFDPWDLVANTAGAAAMQAAWCLGWLRLPWRAAVLGRDAPKG